MTLNRYLLLCNLKEQLTDDIILCICKILWSPVCPDSCPLTVFLVLCVCVCTCVWSYLFVTSLMTVQSLGNISGRIRILKTVKMWRRKSCNANTHKHIQTPTNTRWVYNLVKVSLKCHLCEAGYKSTRKIQDGAFFWTTLYYPIIYCDDSKYIKKYCRRNQNIETGNGTMWISVQRLFFKQGKMAFLCPCGHFTLFLPLFLSAHTVGKTLDNLSRHCVPFPVWATYFRSAQN